LIPSYFLHDENKLILKRGYGQHYRELIVCELDARKINVERYETERSLYAERDVFIFGNKKESLISAYDRLTEELVSTWNIPAKFKNENIERSEVFKDEIIVEFENGCRTNF